MSYLDRFENTDKLDLNKKQRSQRFLFQFYNFKIFIYAQSFLKSEGTGELEG